MNCDNKKERKAKQNKDINLRPKQQNRIHGSL